MHSSFGFCSLFFWSSFTCAGAPYTLFLWISLTFLLEFVHLELLTLALWILFTFLLEFVHLCRSSLYTHPLDFVHLEILSYIRRLDFVHFSLRVSSLVHRSSLHSSFAFHSLFSWEFVHLELLTLFLWILFKFPLEFVHLCRSSLHSSFGFRSLFSWSSFTWSSLHSSFAFRSLFFWSLFTCAGAPYTLVLWISFTFFLEFVHLELLTLVLWISFNFPLVCSLVQELLTLVLWISFTFSWSSFICTRGNPYAHSLELIHFFLGASYTLIP